MVFWPYARTLPLDIERMDPALPQVIDLAHVGCGAMVMPAALAGASGGRGVCHGEPAVWYLFSRGG